MLKTILNRTSLRQWIKKENSNTGHGSSDGNDRTVCKEYSVDLARLVDKKSLAFSTIRSYMLLCTSNLVLCWSLFHLMTG
jgi:hypothetical protein